jgi:plastocyanin
LKYNKSFRNIIIVAAALVALLAWFTIDPATLSRQTIPEAPQPMSGSGIPTSTTTATVTNTTTDNGQRRIAVGGGNVTVSINQFSPSAMEVQSGESVTFYAPAGSTEIHNVVFDLSNETVTTDLELRFLLPAGVSSEALQLAPPNNVGGPIIQNMSDGRQAIVALNKVAFHPSAVDENGNVVYLGEDEFLRLMEQARQQGSFMPPFSANYRMLGTEKMVSSGLILDLLGFAGIAQEQVEEGQQQELTPEGADEAPLPAYPILSSFAVTFEEPGTYPFFCAFHPGMDGVVNVIQGRTTQNQTTVAETQPNTTTAG